MRSCRLCGFHPSPSTACAIGESNTPMACQAAPFHDHSCVATATAVPLGVNPAARSCPVDGSNASAVLDGGNGRALGTRVHRVPDHTHVPVLGPVGAPAI